MTDDNSSKKNLFFQTHFVPSKYFPCYELVYFVKNIPFCFANRNVFIKFATVKRMKDVIEHKGVVESVDNSHVVVKIMQTSACSMCKAHSFCASNENREKHIDIYDNKLPLTVGDEVTVCASASIGWQAVWWAFVVPLIVMVAVLITVLQLTKSEPLAAILGIAALVPYYAVVYMMRGRIQKRISFFVRL